MQRRGCSSGGSGILGLVFGAGELRRGGMHILAFTTIQYIGTEKREHGHDFNNVCLLVSMSLVYMPSSGPSFSAMSSPCTKATDSPLLPDATPLLSRPFP